MPTFVHEVRGYVPVVRTVLWVVMLRHITITDHLGHEEWRIKLF